MLTFNLRALRWFSAKIVSHLAAVLWIRIPSYFYLRLAFDEDPAPHLAKVPT
jgi:hypothetical protein